MLLRCGVFRINAWLDRSRLSKVQVELIDIAPTPGLARLKRSHNGVIVVVMEVLGCVLPNRGIAATHVAALQTQAQSLGLSSNILRSRWEYPGDVADLIEMNTGCHISLLPREKHSGPSAGGLACDRPPDQAGKAGDPVF